MCNYNNCNPPHPFWLKKNIGQDPSCLPDTLTPYLKTLPLGNVSYHLPSLCLSSIYLLFDSPPAPRETSLIYSEMFHAGNILVNHLYNILQCNHILSLAWGPKPHAIFQLWLNQLFIKLYQDLSAVIFSVLANEAKYPAHIVCRIIYLHCHPQRSLNLYIKALLFLQYDSILTEYCFFV